MRQAFFSLLTLSLLLAACGDDGDAGVDSTSSSHGGSAGQAGAAGKGGSPSGSAGSAGSQAGAAGQGGSGAGTGGAGQGGTSAGGAGSGGAGSGGAGQGGAGVGGAGAAGAGQGGAGSAGAAGDAGAAGEGGQGGGAGSGGSAGASGAAGQGGAGAAGASGSSGQAGAAAFRRTAVHQGYGEAWDMASYDLDGDGQDELVMAGRNVVVMPDEGLEANAPRWAHDWAPAGFSTENGDNDWAYAVAVHDADKDGQPDVTALTSQRRLVALRGKDGGALFDVALQGKGQAVSMVTFDGDKDGVPDLFVTGEARAYSGLTGAPLFAVEQPHLHVFSARAELDGDDRDELLLGLERNSIVGPGGGQVGPPETLYAVDHAGKVLWKADVGGNVRALARLDLDGDGKDEVAASVGDAVVVLGPDGKSKNMLEFPAEEPATTVALLRVGGLPLVVAGVYDLASDKAAVVARRLDGGQVFRVDLPQEYGPARLLSALAFPAKSEPVVVVGAGRSSPFGGQVTVLDPAPAAPKRVLWKAEAGYEIDTATLTSWKGQGALAVGGRSTQVQLFGLDDGKPRAGWAPGSFLTAEAAGDLDGDGFDEVASVDDHATLRVVSADGRQLFARKLSVGAAGTGTSVSIVDTDGDGKPEVLAAAQPFAPATAPGVIEVFDAAGKLLRTIPSAGTPDTVRAADLDGDGKPEIVASEAAGGLQGECAVRAYGPDGAALWTTPVGSCFSTLIEVADVDGKPGAEIVYGDTVILGDPHVALLGGDGSLRWSLVVPELTQWIGVDAQKRLFFGSAAAEFKGKLTQRKTSDGQPSLEAFFDGRKESDGIDIPGTVLSATFVPDQDADGFDEIATAHGTGEIRLVSGKTGAVAWTRPLEPTGLGSSDRHTARAVAYLPAAGSAPAYLVASQGAELRMRSRTFALDLAGAITGEVATTGEARSHASVVRTADGPRAAVPTGLDLSLFGR